MTRMVEGVAEIDDGVISWERAGEGPPVTFLHPGLWDRRTWDDQFGLFAKTYRVVRYDGRGYGRSGRPEPGGPYSHVRDLMAVLDVAEIERTAFRGLLHGRGIEIDATLEHPERVTALVLVAPGLRRIRGTPEEEAEWEARDGERGHRSRLPSRPEIWKVLRICA